MRHVRMLGLCLVAAFAMSAVAAASASAVKNPTKSITIFKNCPVKATEAQGEPIHSLICVFAATEAAPNGGHFTVGTITVPLEKQVVLQYGIAFTGSEFFEHERFAPPQNGVEAITPTPEKVPGEPIAHLNQREQAELKWPEALSAKYKAGQKAGSVKKVYETIELAGIPATSRTNIIFEEGVGVEAPVKIKAENKWLSELGDTCYIGSNEGTLPGPIVQHLTTGASTSPLTGETIHGSAGALEIVREGAELWLTGSDLVDNTYAVPGASCAGPYAEQIEALIDKYFGIPAVAGASVTELKGTLYNAVVGVAEKGGA